MKQEKTGSNEAYFYDTYALIEVYIGKKSYIPYKRARVVTSQLNLFELYYSLRRREVEPAKLASFVSRVAEVCLNLTPKLLYEAAEFKLKMRKRRLSYADCLGYVMALRLGVKFLTGDSQFSELPNVEFVK